MFGQIAAANALSDVYAMGGRPITCLNLAGFPTKKLPATVLHDIIAGALDKITEAGALLSGGHTTEDEEPKFGLAITGLVHPEKIWRNVGAQPGNVLALTKPLGTGVLFNANLKNWVSDAAMQACIESVIRLNKTAAEILAEFNPHAVTDVTGFGLGGHAYEMASGSGVTMAIEMEKLPLLDEALAMYQKGMTTGVNIYNREMIEGRSRFEIDLPAWHREIVYDPQTSGGLLIAMPPAEAAQYLSRLQKTGLPGAAIIGEVLESQDNTSLIFR